MKINLHLKIIKINRLRTIFNTIILVKKGNFKAQKILIIKGNQELMDLTKAIKELADHPFITKSQIGVALLQKMKDGKLNNVKNYNGLVQRKFFKDNEIKRLIKELIPLREQIDNIIHYGSDVDEPSYAASSNIMKDRILSIGYKVVKDKAFYTGKTELQVVEELYNETQKDK